MKLFTIGVYGSTEESFFDALQGAKIDTFVDVRQRRGVRGSTHAYVNATRLQERLRELGITYVYVKELAPTKEIRDEQTRHDARVGARKRTRECLGEVFEREYERRCLQPHASAAFKAAIGEQPGNVVLFCVEGPPAACHRSLAAGYLAAELGLEVEHLRP